MAKKPFTTRLDEDVIALAQKIAKIDRRSTTSVLEIALLEYAKARAVELEFEGEHKTEALQGQQ